MSAESDSESGGQGRLLYPLEDIRVLRVLSE